MQIFMNTRTQDSCCQPNPSGSATEALDSPKRAFGPVGMLRPEAPLPPTSIGSAPMMPSSVRRLANMRLLLAELALREMQVDEITRLLGVSPSAARSYVFELRDAGVVNAVHDRDGRFKTCKPSYRLSSNRERSGAFLDSIANAERDASVVVRRGRAGKRGQVTIGMGRSVHIMGDDVHYAIRVEPAPVRRDPLVAALFGAASALA